MKAINFCFAWHGRPKLPTDAKRARTMNGSTGVFAMRLRFYAAFVVAASFGIAGAALAAAQADAICREKVLTRQEQDLCIEQIKHARNMQEQKAVQAKFRKRVDERQAAAKK
jgi:hypothetical protein